ncbi:MAG: response regulator transcription factor [Verrucomicrobia bacterium]|nr:response regulator transcription factor [Verrucomicrobiota bacterium]
MQGNVFIASLGFYWDDPQPIEDAARAAGSASAPAGAETPRRIWIVEDHISVRQLLEAFINLIPGFKVVGVSAGKAPAWEASQRGEVDLVVLDLMIPGIGGINALQKLRALPVPPRVIIYSGTTTVHSLQLALAHGAAGYVDKGDSIEELKVGLQRVSEGGIYFSQGASRLMSSLMRSGPGGMLKLEPTEFRVLELLAGGYSIKDIAKEMKLADQKVYRTRQSLMERADARNAQDLVRYAFEIGLVGLHRAGAEASEAAARAGEGRRPE